MSEYKLLQTGKSFGKSTEQMQKLSIELLKIPGLEKLDISIHATEEIQKLRALLKQMAEALEFYEEDDPTSMDAAQAALTAYREWEKENKG